MDRANRWISWNAAAALPFVLVIAAQSSCLAQESFNFGGKAVEITVGFSAGGGPDLAARIVARHLGRFMPGQPSFVVRNRPGAESVLQVNYMANIAPTD